MDNNQQNTADQALIQKVQQEETELLQQWQQEQVLGYLNTRVVELGIENHHLRQRVAELENRARFSKSTPVVSGDVVPGDVEAEPETAVPEAVEAEEQDT